jgi:uroporphyrin-III C-methyltransferase
MYDTVGATLAVAQSEVFQVAVAQSEVFQVAVAQSEVFQVAVAQPEVFQVAVAQSEVFQVAVAQPEVFQVAVAQSEVFQVAVAQSEVFQVAVAQPEKYGEAFISFASASCGDPDLITVKAANAIQQAEIVLTDRLVSKEILDRYVNTTATVVYVGKQAYKDGSMKQTDINELLVHYAQLGKKIVRLKGGDSSIFGNILDELETVTKHNIPYEIIPGVTAALGAAAYGGIPLTARNYANAVRFLTYWKKEAISETYWQDLAQTDDTLVFYMSSEVLPEVVFHLTKNNISTEKKLAIVEQATTPQQQITTSDLYDFEKNGLKNKIFASPTLIIIGKVVQLHERFKWFEDGVTGFNPLKSNQIERKIHYFEEIA